MLIGSHEKYAENKNALLSSYLFLYTLKTQGYIIYFCFQAFFAASSLKYPGACTGRRG
jgi:hypothetical protein